MFGYGIYPGSCGELVQGDIDGKHFHITCPIEIYSYAQAKLKRGGTCKIRKVAYEFDGFYESIAQDELEKSYLALAAFQERADIDTPADIIITSSILTGKGMASSTADMSAVTRSYAAAHDIEISEEEIASILRAIEPTDGTMFSGIVAYDHLNGKYFQNLGQIDNVEIQIIDLGGFVDTEMFNLFRPNYTPSEQILLLEARELVEKGIKNKDPQLIGQGATISAYLSQEHLPKDMLDEIVSVSRAYGSVGVCVAHSGSVVGVMFAKNDLNKRLRSLMLDELFTQGVVFEPYPKLVNMVSGGAKDLDIASLMLSDFNEVYSARN